MDLHLENLRLKLQLLEAQSQILQMHHVQISTDLKRLEDSKVNGGLPIPPDEPA